MRAYTRRSLADRFWEKVTKSDGCWTWSGATGMGYGRIRRGGKNDGFPSTHHVSWELHFGPIPDGMQVLHHCDNRPCVRPDHLFLGTHADNMADMVAKDRGARGERSANAKLSDDAVRSIRSQYDQGASSRQIARKFGVSATIIKAVVRGDTWAHLPMGERRPVGNARLTPDHVLEAIRLRSDGMSVAGIADRLGIEMSYASRVSRGLTHSSRLERPTTDGDADDAL